jgi:hypothetical protein
MSNVDSTNAQMLRKPEAKARRMAQVRSSRDGWSPPRIHGTTTSRTTPIVPAISFRNIAVERVYLRTARIRAAVSIFDTTSRMLRTRKTTRFQTGSRTTKVSDSPRGMENRIRTILAPARK